MKQALGGFVAGVLAFALICAPIAMAGLGAGGMQTGGPPVSGADVAPATVHTTGAVTGLGGTHNAWLGSYTTGAGALWFLASGVAATNANYTLSGYTGGVFLSSPAGTPDYFCVNNVCGLTWDGTVLASSAGVGDFAFMRLGGKATAFSTAPTITSGFGGSPSIAVNNGTNTFTVNVGSGGAAQTGVIGLPAVTTGWHCICDDITTASSTVFITKQTAASTTGCTVGSFDAAGAASAWVASNILLCSATPY